MQNKINFTAFKFIVTMQWRRNQIERGGAKLIKNLDKEKKKVFGLWLCITLLTPPPSVPTPLSNCERTSFVCTCRNSRTKSLEYQDTFVKQECAANGPYSAINCEWRTIWYTMHLYMWVDRRVCCNYQLITSLQ